MKVILFTRSLNAGGTERQMVVLANGLAARGHQVLVVLLYGGGALEVALDRAVVRVAALDKKGRWDVLGPLWRLRRLFAQERADAIYAFLPMQTTLAALLAPKGSRLVFGLRAGGMELGQYDRLSALAYKLEAWLASRAQAIVANAAAIRAQAASTIDPARIAVVPNGIDTALFRRDSVAGATLRRDWGIAEGSVVVGIVARLDPMKDHANFLRAAAEYIGADERARFVCVGDGDPTYRRGLVALADTLGLGDRVVWAGERRDLPAVYSAFDIATSTSAFGEGFSNAIGEAMACGTPVVATDVGDAALILGDTGIVVPPRKPAALAQAWRDLQARRVVESAGLAEACRARIETRFSVARMIEHTERVLESAIAGRDPVAIAQESAEC